MRHPFFAVPSSLSFVFTLLVASCTAGPGGSPDKDAGPGDSPDHDAGPGEGPPDGGQAACTDADQDGYGAGCALGPDCDDDNENLALDCTDACTAVICVHGQCAAGSCVCDDGWTGTACDSCPAGAVCDPGAPSVPLFSEDFEDADFAGRGWYDTTNLVLSTSEHVPGSTSSVEFRFEAGAPVPTSGGSARMLFDETEEVYVSYWVKYSANWEGSNQTYHPHELYFVTNEDDAYIGPSSTHLTAYVEQNEGVPLLAIQDSLNIDTTRVGEDLTAVTEDRAAAGCNGGFPAEGYTLLDCYDVGEWRNGKEWRVDRSYFTDEAGPNHKNDWHHIEAYFRLNTIVDGVGQSDGVVRYWYDGTLLIDHDNVLLRTGLHPAMRFNQFLLAPYIGDGSPVEQSMWVDDLSVATARPE